MLFKIGILINFLIFIGKALVLESLVNKVVDLEACNSIKTDCNIGGFLWHTGIPGLWTQELDAGRWTLDSGPWTLHLKS